MAQFSANWTGMKQASASIKFMGNKLTFYNALLSLAENDLPFSESINYQIKKAIKSEQMKLSSSTRKIQRIGNAVSNSAKVYESTENKLVGEASFVQYGSISGRFVVPTILKPDYPGLFPINPLVNYFINNWEWKDTWKVVNNFGIIGPIISVIGGAVTGGVSPKTGLDAIKGVAKTVERVASNPSFDWKTVLGLNSTITNKTSKSFFGALSEKLNGLKMGNAKTVSSKVAVGARWAGNILTVLTTAYDNFIVNDENNTTGRQIAETIGESAVKIGSTMLIGAGVTAAFAAAGVAAPVVVVGGITVGIGWAADQLCKHFNNGKDLAETVSDAVLDLGETISENVGKAAKTVTDTVTGWWKSVFG